MKKVSAVGLGSLALLATPLVAFATTVDENMFFENIIGQIGGIVSAAVPVVVGLAVLLFLWGLATYILNQDDAEKRGNARQLMIWGVVIIFVMVALWGLINLLGELTGVDQDAGADVGGLSPI